MSVINNSTEFFKSAPFNDDYDENKNFLKILFRPSYSVQARELTQIQDVIQTQLKRFGNHVFEEGSLVIPGETIYEPDVAYICINKNFNTDIDPDSQITILKEQLVGRMVENVITTNGTNVALRAIIQDVKIKDDDNYYIIYVKYINSGLINGEIKTSFEENDILTYVAGVKENEDLEAFLYTYHITTDGIELPTINLGDNESYLHSGTVPVVKINRGIFYTHNYFVQNDAQQLYLEELEKVVTNTDGSVTYINYDYYVGLEVLEVIIDEIEDPSLLSQANGTQNYNAPGAHRYRIDLILSKREYEPNLVKDPKFINLLTIQNRVITDSNLNRSSYSEIEDTLARRTYDESGDYTVTPFLMNLKEKLNDGTNGGLYPMYYQFDPNSARQNGTGEQSSNNFPIINRQSSAELKSVLYIKLTKKSDSSTRYLFAEILVSDRNTGNISFVNVDKNCSYTDTTDTTNFDIDIRIYPNISNSYTKTDLDNLVLTYYSVGYRISGKRLYGEEYKDYFVACLDAGKAYVKGYEVEKISTNQLELQKARDIVGSTDSKYYREVGKYNEDGSYKTYESLGNKLLVKNIENLPVLTPLISYDLLNIDGEKIGTCKVKYFEYSSGEKGKKDYDDSVTPAVYNLQDYTKYNIYLYDIAITKTGAYFEQTRKITSSSIGFSCDVCSYMFPINGTIVTYVNEDSPTTADEIQIKGINTYFTNDVKVGDILIVRPKNYTNDFFVSENTVKNAKKAYKVNKILNDTVIEAERYIDSGLYHYGEDSTAIEDDVFTNQEYCYIEYACLQDYYDSDLNFNLDNENIKTVTNVEYDLFGDIQLNYVEGTIWKSESLVNKDINIFDKDKFFLYKESGLNQIPINFSSTNLTLEETGNASNPTRNFRFDSTGTSLTSSDTLKLRYYYKATLNNSVAIKKELSTKTEVIYKDGMFNSTKVLLSRVDVTAIDSVRVLNDGVVYDPENPINFDNNNSLDITANYSLDNGMRDNYYTNGALDLKPSKPIATNAIQVTYKFYKRNYSNNSEIYYYSVNSYTGESIVNKTAIEDIPTYKKENGDIIALQDNIDIRPDYFVDTIPTSPTFMKYVTSKENIGEDNGYIPFSYFKIPAVTKLYNLKYEYFIGYYAVISLDKTGDFVVTKGSPDEAPKIPTNPLTSMKLYEIYIPPYTYSIKDIQSNYIENKRYTMRDIGKLENRIDNLEYYTSLTLLEKDTNDLQITDSNGLERYKQGFIVDSFTSQGVGNLASYDYKCCIDTNNCYCRPDIHNDSVSLITPKDSNGDPEISPNMVLTPDNVLMLKPISEETLYFQDISTHTLNVNPFAIMYFIGSVTLNPQMDSWMETKTLKDNIINYDDGSYDAYKKIADQMGVTWDNITETWTGTKNTKTETEKTYIGLITNANNKGNSTFYSADELKAMGFTEKGSPISDPHNFTGKGTDTLAHHRQQVYEVTTTTATEKVKYQVKTGGSKLTVKEAKKTVDYGESVVNIENARYIRNKLVEVSVKRMKPNTKIYPYFDNVNVSKYCYQLVQQGSEKIKNFDLTTDSSGALNFYFDIPENTFLTGERILALSDSAISVSGSGTKAEAIYTASGIIQQKQKTTMVIRTAEIATQAVNDEREKIDSMWEVTSTKTKTTKSSVYDPIAQTFLIRKGQSCYISSIEVFFKSIDDTIPIELQIRETTADDRPSATKVLPYGSVVITPGDTVTVRNYNSSNSSEGTVLESEIETTFTEENCCTDFNSISTPASKSVVFKFSTPVYLSDGDSDTGATYAFVLIADSNNYRVWCAESNSAELQATETNADVAENEIGRLRNQIASPYYRNQELSSNTTDVDYFLMKEPFIEGSFFKSQNSRLWTEDQYIDLMFKINKCVFNTGIVGIQSMVNDFNSEFETTEKLVNNPLYVFNDDKNDMHQSVLVYQPNHGFKVGDHIVMKGIADVDISDITEADNCTVQAVEQDFYTIGRIFHTVYGKSVYKGWIGGDNITVNKIKKCDNLRLETIDYAPENTSIKYDISVLVNTYNTNGNIDTRSNITPNTDIEMTSSVRILDSLNPPITGTGETIKLQCNLESNNKYLTPMINGDALSCIITNNRSSDINIDDLIYYQDGTVLNTDLTIDVGLSKNKYDHLTDVEPSNVENTKLLRYRDLPSEEIRQQVYNSIGIGQYLEVILGENTKVDHNLVTDKYMTDENVLAIVTTDALTTGSGTYDNYSYELNGTTLTINLSNEYSFNGLIETGQLKDQVSGILTAVSNEESLTISSYTITNSQLVITFSSSVNNVVLTFPVMRKSLIVNVLFKNEIVIMADNSPISTTTYNGQIESDKYLIKNVKTIKYGLYYDDIAPVGMTNSSCYETKEITLTNSCTALKIYYASYISEISDLKVYYKTKPESDNREFSEIGWKETIVDDGEYSKMPITANVKEFIDYTHMIENLEPFKSFAVKFVFKSKTVDTTHPSMIKDLRIVALE